MPLFTHFLVLPPCLFHVLLHGWTFNKKKSKMLFGYTHPHNASTHMNMNLATHAHTPANLNSVAGGDGGSWLEVDRVAWSQRISRSFCCQAILSILASKERALSGVISKTKVNKLREWQREPWHTCHTSDRTGVKMEGVSGWRKEGKEGGRMLKGGKKSQERKAAKENITKARIPPKIYETK